MNPYNQTRPGGAVKWALKSDSHRPQPKENRWGRKGTPPMGSNGRGTSAPLQHFSHVMRAVGFVGILTHPSPNPTPRSPAELVEKQSMNC